jgi:hypothetical protein
VVKRRLLGRSLVGGGVTDFEVLHHGFRMAAGLLTCLAGVRYGPLDQVDGKAEPLRGTCCRCGHFSLLW